MSINKIVGFTIMVSFIVFEHVQTSVADELTLDEYLGRWYIVRVMKPTSDCKPVIECAMYDVQGPYGDRQFVQTGRIRMNDVKKKWRIHGEFIDSNIHLAFASKHVDHVMNVTKYNDGQELILIDEKSSHSKLISRKPTASNEAKLTFKRLARKANMHVIHVDHDDCLY